MNRAQPNVVIFYTDDQGTMDAHCYGAADLQTPALDSLARGGTRFTQAYAHTVCCPSRAALLSGRYPQRGGINDWTDNHPRIGRKIALDLSEPTISRELRNAGYRTALFGKWHLGADLAHCPTDFGFDEFFGHRGGFIDNYRHLYLHCQSGCPPFHDLWRDKTEIFETGAYFPDLILREVSRFLESPDDRPFFLYLPFNLPHYPYQADPKFTECYRHLPYPRNLYAAMVSTVDERIGKVLELLENKNLLGDTLLIYMSDNGHSEESYQEWGEEYGAHGGGGYTGEWTGCKNTFYEGGIRVPAIISLPGLVPSDEVRDQIITNMDFFPTILEILNLPRPAPALDGHSLLPILRDSKAPSAYSELIFQWQESWCVRRDEWKLIHRPNREELVRLSDTLPERIDYLRAYPDLAAELRSHYAAWRQDVFSAIPAPPMG